MKQLTWLKQNFKFALLVAFSVVCLLASCKDKGGQEMDLVALPIILGLIGIFLLIRGIVINSSGWKKIDMMSNNTTEGNEKLPFFKQNGVAVFGAILLVAAAAIYFHMRQGN